ncbi:MAG: hypothetical protein JSW07_14690 [bacterium]|nr:MAG: hypothetical protein JSW07_14690 [bacterium]
MKETSDISTITKRLKSAAYQLIAIDGIDGSGKSTLARILSKDLGHLHINLDDYLNKNQKTYVEHIKYDLLKDKIVATRLPIIFEGACVLSVLRNLEIDHDFLIYIKRMSNWGLWRDEKLCDVNGNIDDFIANENIELRKFSKAMADIEGEEFDLEYCKLTDFREEVIRYHYDFRPHEKAHIVFLRTEF